MMIVKNTDMAIERMIAAVSKVEPNTTDIKLRSFNIHMPTPMIAHAQHCNKIYEIIQTIKLFQSHIFYGTGCAVYIKF